MAYRIRKNDIVQVIAGDHRGARGKVLRVNPEKNQVVVEGVNVVFRHVRPTRRNPQGGRIQKEAAFHLSNVLAYDSATGKGARVHFLTERDRGGQSVTKKRVTKSGTVLHMLTRGERVVR